MSLSWFEYNGRNSLEFGLAIQYTTTFDSPKRNVEKFSISGHNGSFLQSNDCYENVPVSYNVAVIPKPTVWNDISGQLSAIKVWLNSCTDDYAKLIDSYNINTYRMAHCDGEIKFKKKGLIYEFTVDFSCEPFRYGVDEIITRSITSNSVTINLCNFECFCGLPIIKITPHLTTSAGMSFTLNSLNWFVVADKTATIDSKTGKVHNDTDFFFYHNGDSENFIAPEDMPTFTSGENILTVKPFSESNIAKIEIEPRWCYI